jgi:hypothetical protein
VTQPITRLSPNRPPEMWSIVVAIFAATIGCTVGRCDVAKIAMFSVASASPAAQV